MEVAMGMSPQLITQSLYDQAVVELKMLKEDNRAGIRLRAVVSAKEQGVKVVAKVFDVSTNTLRSWVKSYANGGIAGLYYKAGRGRKRHLQDIHCKALSEWIQADPNFTLERLVLKLKQVFDVDTSKSAVHRVLLELGLSYITPRPVHHKQNKSLHEEFKKNLKESMVCNPNKSVYFFDESWFGTKSKF